MDVPIDLIRAVLDRAYATAPMAVVREVHLARRIVELETELAERGAALAGPPAPEGLDPVARLRAWANDPAGGRGTSVGSAAHVILGQLARAEDERDVARRARAAAERELELVTDERDTALRDLETVRDEGGHRLDAALASSGG